MQIYLVMKPADPEKANYKHTICDNENSGCGKLINRLFAEDIDNAGDPDKTGEDGESYEKKLTICTECCKR
jgi:hypothetical protein